MMLPIFKAWEIEEMVQYFGDAAESLCEATCTDFTLEASPENKEIAKELWRRNYEEGMHDPLDEMFAEIDQATDLVNIFIDWLFEYLLERLHLVQKGGDFSISDFDAFAQASEFLAERFESGNEANDAECYYTPSGENRETLGGAMRIAGYGEPKIERLLQMNEEIELRSPWLLHYWSTQFGKQAKGAST
jgi:hypothetical protein